ncbi:DUF1822 family protein [Alkalinema pantanalense CENA528]|uniref:DUF1822 family protein n=1 Tax=Alkalinema pantanalense TaxID=1620705 RepID=UPI003D6DADB7
MATNSDYSEEWLPTAEELAEIVVPNEPSDIENAVPIPIASQARHLANTYSAEQPNSEKAQQVRRNTLAVLVLRSYLAFHGYVVDLEASECWNPILRQLGDVADLMVSELGRLECRVFEVGAEFCPLPEEAQLDRIGYVAIELCADDCWGWVLGYLPEPDHGEMIPALQRSQLVPIEQLNEQLERLGRLNQVMPVVFREQGLEEPWPEEDRLAVVALLERIYRTKGTLKRVWAAESAIQEEWRAEDVSTSDSELVTGNLRSLNEDSRAKLRRVLTEIYKQLAE